MNAFCNKSYNEMSQVLSEIPGQAKGQISVKNIIKVSRQFYHKEEENALIMFNVLENYELFVKMGK